MPPAANGVTIDTSGNVSVGLPNGATQGKLEVLNNYPDDVTGVVRAIHASSVLGTGVFGSTNAGNASVPGVWGLASGAGGVGVRGDGTTGVYGNATSNGGIGVTGESNGSTGIAVFGTTSAGIGVSGTAGSGIGVKGTSSSYIAVSRESGYVGLYGKSTGDVGVYGESNSNVGSNAGIYGFNTAGGFAGFFNGKVQVSGQLLVLGGCAGCSPPSDRNLKANFSAINPRSILDRLAKVPIQSWNYKSEPETVRHIGPMAQDFHAAFKRRR